VTNSDIWTQSVKITETGHSSTEKRKTFRLPGLNNLEDEISMEKGLTVVGHFRKDRTPAG
jgi:hypothetical protein